VTGRLIGIARHDRSRGPIEVVDRVAVTRTAGVAGDHRGAAAPGTTGKRQVTLIEAESWIAAMHSLAEQGTAAIDWHDRRANLLIEGLRLPREAGRVIAIGASLRIETTVECAPCSRMDDIAPGLRAALTPDWRGGVCGRVLDDGEIAVGDEARIES